DTDTTVADVRARFGDRIADAVDAETHRKKTGETYEQYIRRLSANPDAVLSKLADIADNMLTSKTWPDSELVRGKVAMWNKARKFLEKTIKPTIGLKFMPDGVTTRDVWRAEQIHKTLDLVPSEPEGTPVTITFMGGGPAAGKTTVKNMAIAKGVISAHASVVIAADDFKTGENDVGRAGAEGIPEYETLFKGGVQTSAVIVHKESTTMAKTALARATMENRSCVYDATMNDHSTDGILIKAAHDAGHETVMMGVFLTPEEGWVRAQKREAKTNRHVPEDVVKNGHILYGRSFPGYIKMVDDGVLDRLLLFDNRPRTAVLIYEKDKDGVVIHDQKAYDDFVRAGQNELLKSEKTDDADYGAPTVKDDGAPDGGIQSGGRSGNIRKGSGGGRREVGGADGGPEIPQDKSGVAGVKADDGKLPTGANGDNLPGTKEPGTAGADGGLGDTGEVSDGPDSGVSSAIRPGNGGKTGQGGTERVGNPVSDADGLPGSKDETPDDFNAGVQGGDSPGSIRGSSKRGQLPGGKQLRNLRLTESLAPTGDTARIKANIAAIQIIRTLEKEKRDPTPEEVQQLAQWSGWGSFKNIFNEGKAERREWDTGWQKKYGKAYDQLRKLLSEEEFNAAAESSVNAHFTGKDIVDWSWAAAERLGFKGGKALEPGAGSGVFIGHAPDSVADQTQWTAVEMEPLTGAILSRIYPEADTRIMGFEETKLPNGYFDLSISNVPFHEIGPGKEYPDLNLHNYFIARMLDKVKPGGLVITVTSKGTMDANPRQRALLASKGQLVAAIRLPNNAFKDSANTSVV
ncbi:MAG: zeta toxin family protein, partial [Verrucomicrobiota bacterium]